MSIMDRIKKMVRRSPAPRIEVDTQLTEDASLSTADSCTCVDVELECRKRHDRPKEEEAQRRLRFMQEEIRSMRGHR